MTSIWAIADLHLSLGTPTKKMDVFGELWHEHMAKIERKWRELVHSHDLVLLAGDISWAMRMDQAQVDLEWIDSLPGTKVMIKGNHDYWWESYHKVCQALPKSIHAIQNNAWEWNGVSIAGARLWDTPEYDFGDFIQFKPLPSSIVKKEQKPAPSKQEMEAQQQKLFQRELQRLELSLQQLHPHATHRIAMTHYPPIGSDLKDSAASRLLEQYRVDLCIFGHLHNVKKGKVLFGKKGGVEYLLTSCDYLDFTPIKVFDCLEREERGDGGMALATASRK